MMEQEEGIFVWEASELGWPPGHCPDWFETDDGLKFHYSHTCKERGEVRYWVYLAGNQQAMIFND